MGWGSLAMIGGSIISGLIGADASKSAAGTQADSANRATDLNQHIYDQSQANLNPYMGFGRGAGTTLSSMLAPGGQLTRGFTPADFLANKDPGYGFQLQQGQQALQNSQAAGNGVLTGSSLKDLIGYNQGMASTGYQNAFDRWQAQNTNVYNRLMGMSQLGENAAAGAGNTGASIGANMAGSMMGAGNAAAAGRIGSANAISGGINNAAGYYYLNQMGKSNTMPVSSSDPYGYGSGQDMLAQFGG